MCYSVKKEECTTIYHQITKEQQQLQKELESIQKQLDKLPAGKLISSKNGKSFKWHHKTKDSLTYIAKNKRDFAEQLALKTYLTERQRELALQLKAIDSYLKYYHKISFRSEQMLHTDSNYHHLLSSCFKSHSQIISEWINAPYEKNLSHPEHLKHKTITEELVRSKSEAMIHLMLTMANIPFRYECALDLGGMTIYPDFTILHPFTKKIYYWEHFGMMDKPEYRRKTANKLHTYLSSNIIPSLQLITTYETNDHPLTTEDIEHIIKQYFLS